MISKERACFNCNNFVSIGYATGQYQLGYCNLSGTGSWISDNKNWDKDACSSYELDQNKLDLYLEAGNTIVGAS